MTVNIAFDFVRAWLVYATMALMASVEELLSAVSGIIGAISGIAGSIVALLSCWANRRPRRDRPGRKRPSIADRERWRARRWAAIAMACLGCALVVAVAYWDLRPIIAASFAVGLSIGSVAVLAMLWRAGRIRSIVTVYQVADSSVHPDLADDAYEPGLVYDREEASVSLERGGYHVKVRRWLVNEGTEPITEVPMTVAVDRYPAQSLKSRSFYRQNPLSMDELKLSASLNGRPVGWRVVADYNSQKEISLRFEDNDERLPLYPGERAVLEYGYSVGVDKWGPWFSRSIQYLTRTLLVEVRLPAQLTPKVWGTMRSTLAEPEKAIDITRTVDGEFAVFRWEAVDPHLFTLVRMRWELTYANRRRQPQAPAQ